MDEGLWLLAIIGSITVIGSIYSIFFDHSKNRGGYGLRHAPTDPPGMIVIGNDTVGWSAKYPGDNCYVWAERRETAIFGCKERAAGR